MNYDVIVVGASPAGLITAWKAAEQQARVLLLEKKTGYDSFPNPVDTSFDDFFRMVGIPVKKQYIIHRVKGMRIVSPLGSTIVIETPGFSFDRREFDRYYTNQAREAGVEIQWNSEAITLHQNGVTANEGGHRRRYKGKIVIFASGNSEISKKTGLATMKHPQDLAYAIQAEMEGLKLDENYFHYFLGKNVAPGWKATISPKGNSRASVGVFVRGRRAKPYFDRFLQRDIFNQTRILGVSRGVDQIITIPNELVDDRVMVVGGAAGQAGIAYGMNAGALCGEVAAEAIRKSDYSRKFLSQYEKQWKKQFLNHYRVGRFGLKTLEQMSDHELEETIRAAKTIDLSQLFSKQGKTFFKAMRTGSLLLRRNPGLFKLLKYLFFLGNAF